jgi:hypothetical protein
MTRTDTFMLSQLKQNSRSRRPAIPFPTSALVFYASSWHAFSMPFCLTCRPFTCQICQRNRRFGEDLKR